MMVLEKNRLDEQIFESYLVWEGHRCNKSPPDPAVGLHLKY